MAKVWFPPEHIVLRDIVEPERATLPHNPIWPQLRPATITYPLRTGVQWPLLGDEEDDYDDAER